MLALTDDQLQIDMTAAASLPIEKRYSSKMPGSPQPHSLILLRAPLTIRLAFCRTPTYPSRTAGMMSRSYAWLWAGIPTPSTRWVWIARRPRDRASCHAHRRGRSCRLSGASRHARNPKADAKTKGYECSSVERRGHEDLLIRYAAFILPASCSVYKWRARFPPLITAAILSMTAIPVATRR